MKTLYLDISSGISGDMFLAALLDLGVDFSAVETALRQLPVSGYHLHVAKKQHSGITGTKFDVHLEAGPGHHHHHEHQAAAEGEPAEDAHAHPGHDAEADDRHQHHHAHEDHPHGEEHEHGHGADDASHPHPHDHDHPHGHERGHEHQRTFGQIRQLLLQSPYSDWVKTHAVAVFARIARAEGKVHGKPVEEVHFHEVGAIDSIVDIVGACLALEMLDKPTVCAAPVVDGTGWVHCAHGRFPVPVPATLEILAERGVTLSQCDEPHELVTPTGAALLAEFAVSFGPIQGLTVARVGYGAGSRTNVTRPNILRALWGETTAAPVPTHDWETDTVTVLETNLDDLSPEILGHFIGKAMAEGALDAFLTPVYMKKNRPGGLLTVVCAPAQADAFTALMLRETSAFGVRRQTLERRKLRRHFQTAQTPYGPVTVKVGSLDGHVLHVTPEFENCRQLAERTGVALREIYAAVQTAPRS